MAKNRQGRRGAALAERPAAGGRPSDVQGNLKEALVRAAELERLLKEAQAGLVQGASPRPKVKVIIYPAEEGGFWAEVPALPAQHQPHRLAVADHEHGHQDADHRQGQPDHPEGIAGKAPEQQAAGQVNEER